ncbi:MAG: primosomal protein N' [Spirochaetales bacterium]|nr:primosomal protein N' [Spirochaetales bacterium]
MTEFIDVALPVPLDEVFTYSMPDTIICDIGFRVEVLFRSRKMTGFIVKIHDSEPAVNFIIKPILRVIDTQPLCSPYLLKLGQWIARRYFCSLGEALSMMSPGGKQERTPGGLFAENEPAVQDDLALSDEQMAAVHGILHGKNSLYYVQGITGSGKTEVFLQCAKAVLEQGSSVLYLVPEIALTHQLIQDIGTRFGPIVGVIHSRLTPSQKLEQWRRIQSGEYRFVIGARSAVFAPIEKYGLIILDEEHENSYKSGMSPRYHARQIAMKIAGDHGAKLVMGSATPSVEAYHLMSNNNMMAFKLTRRLSGGHLPAIQVVDLKGKTSCVSPELIAAIHTTKEEGHQTILFLNRRGFSYFFHCKSCGFELVCKRCSVPLTFHKNKNRLVCHYCGYSTAPLDVCPECGSLDVGYSGFGTQKIEEDIRATFPQYSIERLDTDSVQKKGALEHIISRFKRGEVDILLGTQMVAKGLNFPNVKLVGIVQADTSLKLPDFRSAERTFSLITQVAGRAGRYFGDGKVIVQTFMPENDAIRLAANYETDEFYCREIEMRRLLSFPPFFRIIRIVFRGKQIEKVREAGNLYARALGSDTPPGVEILGPSECPIAVIAGNHRFHILVRSENFSLMHRFIQHYRTQMPQSRGVYIEFDPDPQALI